MAVVYDQAGVLVVSIALPLSAELPCKADTWSDLHGNLPKSQVAADAYMR